MGVLDRFERRLDHLVSGAFARAFRAEVQPVEIASALQRECDDRAAIVSRGRTIVPNAFRVELGPHDHERLAQYEQPLSSELAGMVREHASEHGYAFVGPVVIEIELDGELDTGLFRVRSDTVPGEVADPASTLGLRLFVDGVEHPVTRDNAVLGRGGDADVRIDDAAVSRRHAMLRLVPVPTIVDLDSTNGTYVDGRRVNEAELYDGAVIVVGATEATVRMGT